MRTKTFVFIAFAAIAVATGFNYQQNKQEAELPDLTIANIEALASGESVDREDCETASDLCSMIVIYPDGDYGEDILLGHTKKPGWI